jgi:hypothetical protein
MGLFRYLPAVLLLAAHPVGAVQINYDLVSLGGTSYRYEYTVTNDGSLGATPIEWFDILFDPSLYDETSLTIVTPDPPASDWDETFLQPGLLVPVDYDAYAKSGGITNGTSVSGFAVQFSWLGTGTPGAQPFEVYDTSTFALVGSGSTTNIGAVVPEPGTLFLFLLPSAGVALFRLVGRSGGRPPRRE